MKTSARKRIDIVAGETFVAVGRIEGADGTVLQQAHVQYMDVFVTDISNPTVEVTSVTGITPDVFMFDTLQFDGYEDELGDGDGYNFRFTINTSDWAVGGHNYVIEYRIYTTIIGVKVLQAIVRCATVYQS